MVLFSNIAVAIFSLYTYSWKKLEKTNFVYNTYNYSNSEFIIDTFIKEQFFHHKTKAAKSFYKKLENFSNSLKK